MLCLQEEAYGLCPVTAVHQLQVKQPGDVWSAQCAAGLVGICHADVDAQASEILTAQKLLSAAADAAQLVCGLFGVELQLTVLASTCRTLTSQDSSCAKQQQCHPQLLLHRASRGFEENLKRTKYNKKVTLVPSKSQYVELSDVPEQRFATGNTFGALSLLTQT
jgi:hypothetical protein